jgi:hypothetical protein
VRHHLDDATYHHDQQLNSHLDFPFVIAFFLFQIDFWPFFILPAQGFFNALIYFHSAAKQPRRSTTTTEQPHSSSFFAPSLPQWESFRRAFSRKCSTAIADPIAAAVTHVKQEVDSQDLEGADPLAVVVACVTQEEDIQELVEEEPVLERIHRNGATEGLRIPSDSVRMELSRTISEASMEY